MKTTLLWLLLKWICILLDPDKSKPIVIVLIGDDTIELQESGAEKIVKQF